MIRYKTGNLCSDLTAFILEKRMYFISSGICYSSNTSWCYEHDQKAYEVPFVAELSIFLIDIKIEVHYDAPILYMVIKQPHDD